MPTTQRILELSPAACYLARNYQQKQRGLFGGSRAAKVQPELIYMVYKILNKIYTTDSTYESTMQQQVANYLYELIQKFAFKAANIVDGGGGGQITSITPTSLPAPYYFIVDSSSFIANGETTVQMPISWQGYNVSISRGGLVQTTVTTEPTYFSYNTTTRQLIITPAAVTGELISIVPV